MTGGLSLLILALTAGPAPEPEPVAVVAPAGSRLAHELGRELAAAQLAWVSVVTSDRGWPSGASDLDAAPYSRGVVVASSDARLIIFSRTATTGRAQARLELRFDPSDRPARRRACLAAVEELRALGKPDAPSPASDADEREAPTPPPAPAPPQEVVGLAPPAPGAAAARESWVMGAATMLDVDRRLAAAMVHLQLTWLVPVSERLSFRAQAMWPLMGTALRLGANDVRTWTFGAALGLHYALAAPGARWRPFAGIAAGSQFLLTDTPAAPQQSDNGRALFVPSANLRLQTGVRVAISSRAQLLAELEATRDWLLQPSRLSDYGNSAANALALHASLGVLFEY